MARIAQAAGGNSNGSSSAIDPMAPQTQQQGVGNNPYTFSQGSPEASNQMGGQPYGYIPGQTGRDMSAIENLSDFGFRQTEGASNVDSGVETPEDPFNRGEDVNDPYVPEIQGPPPSPEEVVNDPYVSSSSGIVDRSPWYGNNPEDAAGFTSHESDVYTGIRTPDGGTWSVVDPKDEKSSGFQVNQNDKWSSGNFNIADDTFMGNTAGYDGNLAVEAGLALDDYPWWMPGGFVANVASDALIGYDTENINGSDTITTNGSFNVGEFSDGTATDISGGATGSNVAYNENGDAISLGYGYGQVDPAIAAAAGYDIDPTKAPAPADEAIPVLNITNNELDKAIADAYASATGSTVSESDAILYNAKAKELAVEGYTLDEMLGMLEASLVGPPAPEPVPEPVPETTHGGPIGSVQISSSDSDRGAVYQDTTTGQKSYGGGGSQGWTAA